MKKILRFVAARTPCNEREPWFRYLIVLWGAFKNPPGKFIKLQNRAIKKMLYLPPLQAAGSLSQSLELFTVQSSKIRYIFKAAKYVKQNKMFPKLHLRITTLDTDTFMQQQQLPLF